MVLFIGVSVAVIALVVYSALVVSSKQEELAQRLRRENRFERAPYKTFSTDDLAFETADELVSDDGLSGQGNEIGDADEIGEISEIGEIVFNFKKTKS